MANKKIYTVTQLTRDIRIILENTLGKVWVEGEVSNFTAAASGHAYFSIKDKSSVLNCVMFKSAGVKVTFEIEDGMHLLCAGKISVYDKRGQYQLYVDSVQPQGKGSLQVAFEQLKEKLRKEGLFDEDKKKPVPFLPARVGIVTSSTGAAIQDILKVVRRRFDNTEILLRPVKVQGDEAKKEIALAIKEFNEYNVYLRKKKSKKHPIDVIIAGRGGGSLEDLWAFNEETVARAIYSSKIPVVSAVGHEIDFTIADFTADVRAATPSAAAEMIVPVKKDIMMRLKGCCQKMYNTMRNKIDTLKASVEVYKDSYVLREPVNVLLRMGQRIDDITTALDSHVTHFLELKQRDLRVLSGKLDMLSPLAVLERGYSITLKGQRTVSSPGKIKKGDIIRTKFFKGEITSQVKEIKK